ncbi:MAG: bifunctional [glutamate--ammonia ligase]-adenylyl-L-tyrosine phosphorylase/[glutamate--ammonia-ligase] adenylyltransferase [Rhodospirillales bacterium]
MQRDLDGRADLAEVTAGMTALAEIALGSTITWFDSAMRAEFGVPRGETGAAAQPLQAVGMGKLGGGELNVSSDIDLVFVYPEEGETDGPRRIGNHEYFTRLARRVIRALDDLTAEGRVFRVDMRLRPDGESGPLACGYDMLEQYFVAQGREWERYAWIKARVVAGGNDAGLARIVHPFVYRKYLDFGAFAAMRALHAQIRAEVVRRELADNIKLGPGGIREIEFIAQVFQLIRGGREPALQLRPTLHVLDLLAARGLLPQDAARGLAAAYVFLRRLEHRLQYLDDQQTHQLPQDAAARARVAQAMGVADYDTLLRALARHRELVGQQFEAIFAGREAETHPLAGAWLAGHRHAAGCACGPRLCRRRSRRRAPAGDALRLALPAPGRAGTHAFRPPGSARHRARGRDRESRRHARAGAGFSRSHMPQERLPRASGRIAGRPAARDGNARGLVLGGTVPGPESAAARRIARFAPCSIPRSTAPRSRTNCARRWRRTTMPWWPTPSARWTCCAKCSTPRYSGCWRRTLPACSAWNASPTTCRTLPTAFSRWRWNCAGARSGSAMTRTCRLRRASLSSVTANSAARKWATNPTSTWCSCSTIRMSARRRLIRSSGSAWSPGLPAPRPPGACSTSICACVPTAIQACW